MFVALAVISDVLSTSWSGGLHEAAAGCLPGTHGGPVQAVAEVGQACEPLADPALGCAEPPGGCGGKSRHAELRIEEMNSIRYPEFRRRGFSPNRKPNGRIITPVAGGD